MMLFKRKISLKQFHGDKLVFQIFFDTKILFEQVLLNPARNKFKSS